MEAVAIQGNDHVVLHKGNSVFVLLAKIGGWTVQAMAELSDAAASLEKKREKEGDRKNGYVSMYW